VRSLLCFLDILLLLLNGFLDDTDSNGLLHISNGESTKWWELVESLNNHWLGWGHSDDSGITSNDVFWVLLSGLTSSLIHLLLELSEFTSDVTGVAIKDWSVTGHDLTWMVHDDNLSLEVLGIHSWGVLGIRGNVTSLDISNGKSLNVETNIVSWNGLSNLLVMHLDGFTLGSGTVWTEADGLSWLDDTSLDSTDWDGSDTRDLVDILEWKSQWLENWSLWWLNGIEGLE